MFAVDIGAPAGITEGEFAPPEHAAIPTAPARRNDCRAEKEGIWVREGGSTV
jgi:hypothetical protein